MFDLFMLPEGHKLSLCIIRNFSAIIYDASELKLVASAYSPTIVELIGELFIGELLNYNFSDFPNVFFN